MLHVGKCPIRFLKLSISIDFKPSELLEEILVLQMDRAQLLAVLPEGGDLLLLLLLAQHFLLLEFRLLVSELLEAELVILLLLLLQQPIDGILADGTMKHQRPLSPTRLLFP